MIEGQDYCYIYPKNEKDTVHIKLLTGKYKDTIFRYGKVSFRENGDNMHLLFAYYVIQSPIMKPKKLEKDLDFKQFAGDLLVNIMSANLDEEIIDESGNSDSEESDL
jgi:hypothetical protein